ncbi:hypothetical protein [Thiorhodovibrio frisius]|uniref:Uncharacterized protein n=1 Tax=Thiorhodovibrio frisius TaxID=631362 RepID=H8Z7A8_9GAMM|nr:hypothetical protein [Thiorhodovibrio frisius]EIC19824.1 hypothetical protein Thi970DRAFT_03428 [Thiorhodovibrio frisius]WPL20552.1 hypothetical protein Thiofri_00651 [Thiorhodovibrio frisius]
MATFKADTRFNYAKGGPGGTASAQGCHLVLTVNSKTESAVIEATKKKYGPKTEVQIHEITWK